LDGFGWNLVIVVEALAAAANCTIAARTRGVCAIDRAQRDYIHNDGLRTPTIVELTAPGMDNCTLTHASSSRCASVARLRGRGHREKQEILISSFSLSFLRGTVPSQLTALAVT
jgi:hypothetical protein